MLKKTFLVLLVAIILISLSGVVFSDGVPECGTASGKCKCIPFDGRNLPDGAFFSCPTVFTSLTTARCPYIETGIINNCCCQPPVDCTAPDVKVVSPIEGEICCPPDHPNSCAAVAAATGQICVNHCGGTQQPCEGCCVQCESGPCLCGGMTGDALTCCMNPDDPVCDECHGLSGLELTCCLTPTDPSCGPCKDLTGTALTCCLNPGDPSCNPCGNKSGTALTCCLNPIDPVCLPCTGLTGAEKACCLNPRSSDCGSCVGLLGEDLHCCLNPADPTCPCQNKTGVEKTCCLNPGNPICACYVLTGDEMICCWDPTDPVCPCRNLTGNALTCCVTPSAFVCNSCQGKTGLTLTCCLDPSASVCPCAGLTGNALTCCATPSASVCSCAGLTGNEMTCCLNPTDPICRPCNSLTGTAKACCINPSASGCSCVGKSGFDLTCCMNRSNPVCNSCQGKDGLALTCCLNPSAVGCACAGLTGLDLNCCLNPLTPICVCRSTGTCDDTCIVAGGECKLSVGTWGCDLYDMNSFNGTCLNGKICCKDRVVSKQDCNTSNNFFCQSNACTSSQTQDPLIQNCGPIADPTSFCCKDNVLNYTSCNTPDGFVCQPTVCTSSQTQDPLIQNCGPIANPTSFCCKDNPVPPIVPGDVNSIISFSGLVLDNGDVNVTLSCNVNLKADLSFFDGVSKEVIVIDKSIINCNVIPSTVTVKLSSAQKSGVTLLAVADITTHTTKCGVCQKKIFFPYVFGNSKPLTVPDFNHGIIVFVIAFVVYVVFGERKLRR